MEDVKLFLQKTIPGLIIHTIIAKEGEEHKVVEVNHVWIFRFAKALEVQNHMTIEVQLLKQLANTITACAIPRVTYYFPNTHCFGYQKIGGVPLTSELYAQLTIAQKNMLAHTFAKFLYELHSSISVHEAQSIDLVSADWPLNPAALQERLAKLDDERLLAIFTPFIKEYHCAVHEEKNLIVVHNDLHPGNILIDPATKRLLGIIDFSCAAIGNLYHEFRYLHLIDMELVALATQEYSKISGLTMSVHDAYLYCMATEFSRLAEALEKKDWHKCEGIRQRIYKLAHSL